MHVKNKVNDSYNVAPNENLSVYEMAKTALRVADCEYMTIKYDSSLPNGQFRKDVSNHKMKKYYKDFKFLNLEDGMREIYKFYEK